MSFWLGFALGALAVYIGPSLFFGAVGMWLLIGLALTVWLIYQIYK